MRYQYDREYLFDSTKFAKAFNVEPTSYEDGVRMTADGYKQ
jgi:nucleoside-diphosphate-sugar epimerase